MVHRLLRRWTKSLAWFRGIAFAYVHLPIQKALGIPLARVHRFARRIPFVERHEYSQNGEDGIIHAIFTMIGTTNRYFVEFGVEDGIECNTRYLATHKGWKGLLMDGGHDAPAINLHREFITAENIESLFAKYGVPEEFDLLSIDIDGNDYWVWKAITHYRPRVVIIEYNACLPYEPAVSIPYDKAFQWDKTDYYGASLSALVTLAKEKGYTLITTDPHGVNAFFVSDACIPGAFRVQPPENIYRPAAFKGKPGNAHPKDHLLRSWTLV